MPVFGHLFQIQRLTQVDQTVYVLLEAATTEADARLEKLVSNATIAADGTRYFLNVRSAGLAYGRYRVYAGDFLRQKCVRRQFGQLRRPCVCFYDERRVHPVLVDFTQLFDGPLALASDENAIRLE